MTLRQAGAPHRFLVSEGSQHARVAWICPRPYSSRHSERSAARLAHQSGGLGVPSSNLGAPTSTYLRNLTLNKTGWVTPGVTKDKRNWGRVVGIPLTF